MGFFEKMQWWLKKRRKKSRLFVGGLLEEKPKRNYFKLLLWGIFDICLVIGIAGLGWIFWVLASTPELQEIEKSNFAQSSVILDKTGEKILYTLYGEENREVVSLENVAPSMQKAMLAAEDADFYNHSGIDTNGILRSVYYLLANQQVAGGGSTITQQLIKTVIFAKQKEGMQEKLERKVKEIHLAKKLEEHYSKDKILELYLNKVPFGRNAYGIEKAAKIYFGKSAKDLTIAESAVLAGLPQRPGVFGRRAFMIVEVSKEEMEKWGINSLASLKAHSEASKKISAGILGVDVEFPDGHTEHLDGRFEYVLGQMKEKNFITAEEFDKAKEEAKTMKLEDQKVDMLAPHFVMYVQDYLEKEFPEQYSKEFLQQGGLKIYTTLDYDLQQKAEEMVKKKGESNEKLMTRNMALVSLDVKTGGILAMVGSRDYFAKELNGHEFDGEVNVAVNPRQPGSSFKPIAYAAAFEYAGLAPETVLMDVTTDFGGGYTPQNFDGHEHGPVSIRKALGNSYNIPAVKAGLIAGIPKVYELGEMMGIHFQDKIQQGGLSIGASPVSPIEMAQAYAVFANKGKKVKANPIAKIVNGHGEVLFELKELEEDKKEPVLSEETAYLISNILSDSSARGPGWSKTLTLSGRTAAAKTGTSNGRDEKDHIRPHDVWTVGYTPQIATAVWAGNNKGWEGNEKGLLANNIDGLGGASPVWQEFMNYAHKNLPKEEFQRPKGIKTVRVSKLSGKIPPENFPEHLIIEGLFDATKLPDSEDTSLKILNLEDSTKTLPNEFTPQEAQKEYAILNFQSERPKDPAWEGPVQEWVKKNKESLIAMLGVENLLDEIPKETTTMYSKTTKDNIPEIKIASPSSLSSVSPPFITVEADATGQNGLSKVEFFWDGQLVATKESAPWSVKINIGESAVGSTHTIKAEAVDRLFYRSAASEIQVKIGEDSTPPEIAVLSPENEDSLVAGTLYQVKVDATDRNSAVASIDFFFDGNLVDTKKNAPFTFSWTVPNEAGNHTLKFIAKDTAKNSEETSVNISISGNANEGDRNFGITNPKNGKTMNVNENINISAFIPENLRVGGNTFEIIAEPENGKKEVLFSMGGGKIPSSGDISTSWKPQNTGTYNLSIRSKGINTEFSQKISLTVK